MDRTKCEYIRKVRDEFQQTDVFFCEKPRDKNCTYCVNNYTESYCLHHNRETIAENKRIKEMIIARRSLQ